MVELYFVCGELRFFIIGLGLSYSLLGIAHFKTEQAQVFWPSWNLQFFVSASITI